MLKLVRMDLGSKECPCNRCCLGGSGSINEAMCDSATGDLCFIHKKAYFTQANLKDSDQIFSVDKGVNFICNNKALIPDVLEQGVKVNHIELYLENKRK
jgi:hypothetical protein